MSQKKNSVMLDVEKSSLENTLKLEGYDEEDIEFFKGFMDTYEKMNIPWKLIKPSQGMCIKTHTPEGDKVFINVCHSEKIVCPKILSDEDILRLWNSDELQDYRLPMSIGEGHEESDKSGNPAMAYDIIINSVLFKKVEASKIYLKFLIAVLMEAVQDKFKIELDPEDYTILKNRKAMGKIQIQRIKQRSSEEQPGKPLIEEVSNYSSTGASSGKSSSKPTPVTKKPSSEPLMRNSSVPSADRQPEYRVWQQPADGDAQVLVAELKMDEVLGARELSLDVGEDRLVVESRRHGNLLDVFFPYSVDQENTSAHFNKDSRILTVTMPVSAAANLKKEEEM